MHKGWLAAGGNHPVCIRVKKGMQKPPSMYTVFFFCSVYIRDILLSTRYTHGVVFPKKHTQYVYRFFGKPVYIQVALYVYGQSLHPGFNIYVRPQINTVAVLILYKPY